MFSPDGRRFATATKDGTARLWQTDHDTRPLTLEGHEDAIWHLAWAPVGGRLVTASADGAAKLWDTTTGLCVRTLRGHQGWVGHAVFSRAGDRIATSGQDATAVLREAEPAARSGASRATPLSCAKCGS